MPRSVSGLARIPICSGALQVLQHSPFLHLCSRLNTSMPNNVMGRCFISATEEGWATAPESLPNPLYVSQWSLPHCCWSDLGVCFKLTLRLVGIAKWLHIPRTTTRGTRTQESRPGPEALSSRILQLPDLTFEESLEYNPFLNKLVFYLQETFHMEKSEKQARRHAQIFKSLCTPAIGQIVLLFLIHNKSR